MNRNQLLPVNYTGKKTIKRSIQYQNTLPPLQAIQEPICHKRLRNSYSGFGIW
ncbi:hypothetical protein [Chryseobacterium lathyri]|uniref:hypothetical protein n=1 Tax=Chryseobacterium lathyri TaxID=395933 RepID=UPI00130034DC|nr:hypothetical protein [Chryseobacterium lathyri]